MSKASKYILHSVKRLSVFRHIHIQPHTTPWADVPATDKPQNSCFGALLRMPQAKIAYGYDGLGTSKCMLGMNQTEAEY